MRKHLLAILPFLSVLQPLSARKVRGTAEWTHTFELENND